MYGVFVEVNAEESHIEAGREYLNQTAAPGARAGGAVGGYWLAPRGGRAVSVIVFETEESAREMAQRFQVGEAPGPGAPAGITVRTVEVREVLASV